MSNQPGSGQRSKIVFPGNSFTILTPVNSSNQSPFFQNSCGTQLIPTFFSIAESLIASSANVENLGTFDKLIDVLLDEVKDENQLDEIKNKIFEAMGREDLSANLKIISDVDETLKGLDDPGGLLDTIKTELTTLSGVATSLKEKFNSLTATLESFVGNLIDDV